MVIFLISLLLLIAGYILYGAVVEKIFGADSSRKTPAYHLRDDVDFVPMPSWKVFLIQFLNIAGLGPIFGAIMGVMFGPSAFLWIVFGTIFGGAVHDYLSGMISLRKNGGSLPEIVGEELGGGVKQTMRAFSMLLMILVGAVFVVNPADLLAGMTPDTLNRIFWICVIFAYYMLATLLPVDKLIGKIYPLFGAALLFMAVGLLGYMLFTGIDIPIDMNQGLYNRAENAADNPIFPMMFVSIACGAISGFHATQSPMMARCLKNEKMGRPIFYGAMVAEGIVALIWAAAAITFTGGYTQLEAYMDAHSQLPATLVNDISVSWLGKVGGILAILGVVAAPITTGDTALRSARLIAADFLGFSQKTILKRLIISVPVFILTFIVMTVDFTILWRYFGWCNQTLSVFTLWAITVFLSRKKGYSFILTLLPAMFMTCVCVSYLLYAPSLGIALDYSISVGAGLILSFVFLILFFRKRNKLLMGLRKEAV
ncbi:MAG: carbon starvation protein A [Muribaculaceae bacterium]|nr:carbon starvation protein A [Muribaculaceae bacterium]